MGILLVLFAQLDSIDGGSCNGSEACLDASGVNAEITDKSCNGNNACAYMNVTNYVRDSSCNGDYACFETEMDIIEDGCCNGNNLYLVTNSCSSGGTDCCGLIASSVSGDTSTVIP